MENSQQTLMWAQYLYCQLWTMFGYAISLKFRPNLIYTKVWNRMIKTGIIKVKSIENEEMIMAMTKIIITTVIIKIMIIIRMITRVKIGKHIKIEKC